MIRNNINNYVFIFAVIASFFLQTTFIPQVFPQNMMPDLVLVVLISGSFLASDDSALYAAFAIGYLVDIYSGKYFGAVMISYVVAAFFALYASYYLLKEVFSIGALLSAVLSVVLYNAAYYLITYSMNSYKPVFEIGNLITATTSDTLLLLILFYPLIFIFSYNRNEK